MATSISDRFGALLRGDSTNSYDRPLIQTSEYVVAPSLGAVVPGWLIAVPRTSALNFLDLSTAADSCANNIVRDVVAYLRLDPSEIVWFEHGPSKFGTAVGCGADYAHIHIIVRPAFSYGDVVMAAERMSRRAWTSVKADSVYDALPRTDSYVLVSQMDEARYILNVESLGSQFMRRVIATLSGQRSTWDYKKFPHASNIDETIAMVRALEGDASRA